MNLPKLDLCGTKCHEFRETNSLSWADGSVQIRGANDMEYPLIHIEGINACLVLVRQYAEHVDVGLTLLRLLERICLRIPGLCRRDTES